MIPRITTVGILFFAALLSGSASAHEGLKAAIAERNAIVQDLKGMNLERPAQIALDRLLGVARAELEKRGHFDLAQDLRGEWEKGLSEGLFFPDTGLFGSFGDKDLGDHKPLLVWLESAIERIEGVIPAAALNAIPGLRDLRTLNFAMNVVFRPGGLGKEKWDWLEYRKHFIPFVEIIVYWGARITCNVLSAQYAPPLKRLCEPAASILKAVTARTVAAPISDMVFFSVNPTAVRPGKHPKDLEFTLPIQTEEELLAAIEE